MLLVMYLIANKDGRRKVKKFIILLLSVGICLSLVAYGSGSGGKNLEIGNTYTSNGVEFTVNYFEFTDVMDNWGGANDNYWMPLPNDAVGHQLENAVSPKSSDDTILVVSYTAKNVSKSDKTIKDRGTLDYDNGYTYSEGGLSYRVSPTGVWSDLESGLVLEKLKENSYEFRVWMVVPKVVADSDKSLTYTLFGEKFTIR